MVWKVVTVITNRHFTASITFYNILHGFQRMVTSSLEAKLIQQLAAMREEVLYVIFIDLHKACDDLDRDICLDILEGYGMGPQAHHILQEYWDRLWMVDHSGGYYGLAFKGFWGVTQGDPLPTTLLNIVVEAVVRNLILLAELGSGEKDGWGREVRHCAGFFYAEYGLVALTDLVWMQGVFDTLTRLFDRVGL